MPYGPGNIQQKDNGMADHGVAHFHNDPGVPVIEIGAREFMCVGARPPFDHPHIFCDMGGETEVICSYCSTLYRHDSTLGPHAARPAECELREPAGVWAPPAEDRARPVLAPRSD